MNFPLHRFEEFGPLTAPEREFIAGMGDPPQGFRRDETIRGEGTPSTHFYLLADGWAAAARTMPDGGRQILKVHLPGDVLGTPSMCSSVTVEELFAITDVMVVPVELARFATVFEAHPRMAARFLLSVQQERVALMDRLVSIGRSSAEMSVAAFLIDLMERLEPLGLIQDNRFDIVVKQEQIADVVGLTSVHTNRVLRSLEQRGLISRAGHRYMIADPDALAGFSGRTKRQPLFDAPWLPTSRETIAV
jgi:CRP/FNR family transcriptional regulator